jgi:predicted aminopeptidase
MKPLTFACFAFLTGCSAIDTADYYWQGASGQMEILSRAKPIDEVINESTDAALKQRLARVQQIRAFASRELGLPDNRSYTRYSDLGRPFVVWNVFAAPQLSLKAKQWCFPVAGCVNYRGYFNEQEAKDEAARLEAAGEDVWLSGVPAYSTLGYFDDPVLSTFVRWPETEVARMVFHELAHQVVYVKDDTQFNESFAVTVEEEGVRRWLAAQGNPQLDAQFERSERLRAAFRELVTSTRAQLVEVYASSASDRRRRLPACATAMSGPKPGSPASPGTTAGSRASAAPAPTMPASRRSRCIPGRSRRSRRCLPQKAATCRGSTRGSGASPRSPSRSATARWRRPPGRRSPRRPSRPCRPSRK